jgi:hypothetical protein
MTTPAFRLRAAIAFCGLALAVFPGLLFAQRFPERFFTINPLGVPLSQEAIAKAGDSNFVWMSAFGFWAGFERYADFDPAHAWRSPFGAFAEIARWRSGTENGEYGKRSAIFGVAAFDHVADPDNDITFNPRAVWWEEGVVFATELDSVRFGEGAAWSSLQIGYYHRCRHEIDNLFRNESRVMIYGSLTGKYLLEFPRSANGVEGFASARADIYTIRTDYRFPFAFDRLKPNFFDLVGSVGFNAHIRGDLPWKQLGWYAGARLFATAFADDSDFFGRFGSVSALAVDYGAILGVSVEGAVRCRIGVQYEYLSDTEMQPFPESRHLLSIGFSFSSPYGLP